MKVVLLLIMGVMSIGFLSAQDLPKDVEKVYKGAEHLKKKKQYSQAVSAYKEVLRSVDHVPSMASIGEIEMELRSPPNYREAYEYYNKAIIELERQISATEKKKEKYKLAQEYERLVPKRKRAKTFVDDFDKAKNQKHDGDRLLEYD